MFILIVFNLRVEFQAALHDIKFLELLIQCGAETTVRTSTQQMTALHVVLLQGKKSAEDTLQTAKLLMEHGLRDLVRYQMGF